MFGRTRPLNTDTTSTDCNFLNLYIMLYYVVFYFLVVSRMILPLLASFGNLFNSIPPVMTQIKKGRRSDANRNRPRITFTLSKEVIEALHQRTSNMSDFVDRVLRSVLFEEPAELVVIIPKQTGPGPGFEPGSWDPQSQRITSTPSGPSAKQLSLWV